MICLNMPLYIVAAFLVLTFAVAVYFSRKKTTFREYAVGNKQFSTATLVATVLATLYGGGGLVRTVECVHGLGLYWIVITLLSSFGFWMISKLALRMGRFMQHLSIAETIGDIYGKYPRIIVALFSICGGIVSITIQINVMSHAISMCLDSISPFIITIFATLLLIFYSSFGGVRAVTYTDVLQFITFSIVIPCLAWFMFVKVGKPVSEIVPILQSHSKFQFSSIFHFNTQLVGMLLLLFSLMISYIEPQIIQRVYMASGPIQARNIFSYAAIFRFVIASFITLIGLFVFAGAPSLPKEAVWDYVVTHIPSIFKGFVAISLLAMAMSTADSRLNACAVMVSHDILKSLQTKKEITDVCQLKIARWTTLVVGLLAMIATFYCKDLLKLMTLSLACAVPIVAAPFILAVFGFRGTSRTALIGMITGVLAILAWNKWIKPSTGMDGSFVAMVANGLAMLAAHYFLKQPEETGWVEPDIIFKQIQQEKARKRAERKEAIKNAWANKKVILAKLIPSYTVMVYVGCYIAITILLSYFIAPIMYHGCSLMLQLFLAASLVGYPFLYGSSKKIRAIPKWFIGLYWLMTLVVYLPLSLLGDWWYLLDPIFNLSLFLTDSVVVLWVLPLYLGIGVVATTALLGIFPILIGFPYPVLCSLLPLCVATLIVFTIVICLKVQQGGYSTQVLYLKKQEKIRLSQQLKASLYDATLVPSNGAITPKGYGFILNQVVRKIEESISFLDNHTPIFKEDFQSIINKLYDWVAYFNSGEKAKDHALLQPNKITLDKLMRKVEVALAQEVSDPPRLLVEKINTPNQKLCPDIVCDIHQIVYLLVKAILRLGRLTTSDAPVVRIQLQPTALQFKQADSLEGRCPTFMDFQAIALVVSQANDAHALPKVQECYRDITIDVDPKERNEVPPSIDLEQDTLSSVVRAHYGYLEPSVDKKASTMLVVLPKNVTDILDKMPVALPLDALTSEGMVTPKEQADSMMALMKFHDHVCKSLCKEDPVDLKTISSLILLLRQHFRFRRHGSGQLFYVRSVGIAELVVDWVFHSPKVIYAALLYELVRRTCLPLSYIKQHYNLGVYAFVSNVVKIDKRQALDHPSLLYVQNRLEQAIKEDHLQLSVLFIKLAERLYDLRHAAGYTHSKEVQSMAQETLTIDVPIANAYLGPEIGAALEAAAKEALAFCKNKDASEKNNKK